MKKRNKLLLKHFIWLIPVVVSCVFIIIFTVESLGTFRNNPKVQVQANNSYEDTLCIVADYAFGPFSYIDWEGVYQGHDVELAYIIGNKLKKNVNLKLLSWDNCQKALESGQADLLLGYDTTGEDKAEIYVSTVPVVKDNFSIFSKKKMNNIAELYGKKVGVLVGNSNYEMESMKDTFVSFDSYEDMFEALEKGEIDALKCRSSVGNMKIRENGYQAKECFGVSESFISINALKGREELISELNLVITGMSESGELSRLYEKWISPYGTEYHLLEVFKEYQTLYLVVFVLIFMYLFIMGSSLRKERISQKRMEAQEETLKMTKMQISLLEAISKDYKDIFIIDPIEENSSTLKVNGRMLDNARRGMRETRPYDEAWKEFMDRIVLEEDKEELRKNITLEHVLQELTDQEEYVQIFRCNVNNQIQNCQVKFAKFQEGELEMLVAAFRNIDDVLEQKRKMEIYEEAAKTDLMTGLLNKTEFLKEVRKVISEEHQSAAFLFLDLDHFKEVNDTLGHAMGDAAIIRAASNLSSCFRKSDLVARFGGDEFCVCLTNVPSEFVMNKAEEIIRKMTMSFHDEWQTVKVTCSIGVVYDHSGVIRNHEVLMEMADGALYRAKERGRNGYQVEECGLMATQ